MRRTISLPLTLYLLLHPVLRSHAGEQVQKDWVRRHDDPGSGIDIAKAMAVDSAGNIYVTGASDYWKYWKAPVAVSVNFGFFTVKHDSQGNLLWTNRYEGPGLGPDIAVALALDPEGNVLVTGYCQGNRSVDFATVKYSPQGKQLWVARYGGPEELDDIPHALAVDRAGNVLVAGYSETSRDGDSDFQVVKYGPDGTLLWVARYHETEEFHNDEAVGIAVDLEGEVYVTGSSSVWAAQGYHVPAYVTLKYDSDGNLLWRSRLKRTADAPKFLEPLQEEPYAIAVDGAGNSVVTGVSGGDYATVKYDPEGNQLWARWFSGGGHDVAAAISIDAGGSIYVTGATDFHGHLYGRSTGGVTLKYDPLGNEIWLAREKVQGEGQLWFTGIAVDGTGAVAVAGLRYGSNHLDTDYLVVKYDREGGRLWEASYDGPLHDLDRSSGVALDSGGNVLVTGFSEGGLTLGDYATLKYGPGGDLIWTSRVDGPGNGLDLANDMSLDGEGNVYITGSTSRNGALGESVCLTWKFDPRGNLLWLARYEHASGFQIALANEGSVMVSGSSGGDPLLLKYDSHGSLLWAVTYEGSSAEVSGIRSMALDGAGNAHLTGATKGARGDTDYLTIKYDHGGKLLWAERYDGPAGEDDQAKSIAVDREGNVYVTGTSEHAGVQWPAPGFATVKYDARGKLLWAVREDESDEFDSGANAVAVDAAGNVLVTGVYHRGYLTVKYDPSGNRLWQSIYSGFAVRTDHWGNLAVSYGQPPAPMALDREGNVHVGGTFIAPDTSSYLVLKYDAKGLLLWERMHDVPGRDRVTGLALDPSGNVYVTGTSSGFLQQVEMATVKYSPQGEELWVERFDEGEYNQPNSLAVDGSESVLIAGMSGGRWKDEQMVVVKYSPVWKFIRGDCNGDGSSGGVADAVFLLHYHFRGGDQPPCLAACDADGDGLAGGGVTDAIYLIQHNFLAGPPPPPPYPGCEAGATSGVACDRPLDC